MMLDFLGDAADWDWQIGNRLAALQLIAALSCLRTK